MKKLKTIRGHGYIIAITVFLITVIAIGVSVIALGAVASGTGGTAARDVPAETPAGEIPEGEMNIRSVGSKFLMPGQAKDPEVAKEFGISGYVEVSLAEPSLVQTVNKGEKVDIPILLHFVSYNDTLTDITVTLNPQNDSLLAAGQVYSILDEKGEIIGKGHINLNDLISYDVRYVEIESGETKNVMMSVLLPNIPDRSTLKNIPLRAVGILAGNSDVVVVDSVKELSATLEGDMFTVRRMQ